VDDQEHLHLLTPRERDVWEVWRKHPDWSNAQIGRAVYMPAPHVIRRYKENIKTKLAGLPPFSSIEVEVLDLVAEGMSHAEIARSIGTDERTVRLVLRRIEIKRGTAELGREDDY
jgi:FixJ family two-component response regulator